MIASKGFVSESELRSGNEVLSGALQLELHLDTFTPPSGCVPLFYIAMVVVLVIL
jgi:hypothetical protein